ncbi:MAG: sporulation initiation factor Spo0A C-terminal domain-containing protein [Clostridia bacterium]|nr:sporulation initiation factor Spo0A C-terminal domain-containing protein [Clostridia bacterium]
MEIQDVFRRLGIGRQYLGYNAALRAVEMTIEDESCLYCVKQGIYVPISVHANCDWRTVERNIRTVIQRAWCVNPDMVIEMAGFPLHQAPTVTEFIEMVSAYVLSANHSQRKSMHA